MFWMQFWCISAAKMSTLAEWRSRGRYVTKAWHNAALVGQKFGSKKKFKMKNHVYGRSVTTVQNGPGK